MCEGRRSRRANIYRDIVYLTYLRRWSFVSWIQLKSGETRGYYNTYYNNTGVRTCNLFQVKKKKKKEVLFVAPGNQARVNVHRKRLRKGAPVMHDHNGKMYKGTVVEKEGDGQVLIAYPDHPGYCQKYKGEDAVLYVKST